MNLEEILKAKKIFSSEFTTETLSDYIFILSALSIKLSRLASNINLPSILRVDFFEDADMLNSVVKTLKKFS